MPLIKEECLAIRQVLCYNRLRPRAFLAGSLFDMWQGPCYNRLRPVYVSRLIRVTISIWATIVEVGSLPGKWKAASCSSSYSDGAPRLVFSVCTSEQNHNALTAFYYRSPSIANGTEFQSADIIQNLIKGGLWLAFCNLAAEGC